MDYLENEDDFSNVAETETKTVDTAIETPDSPTKKSTSDGSSERDKDLALVRKVQAGDTRAFDLLVLKYQHKVAGLISRFVHDKHEVQDVTQETFIKAYRGLKNFRGDSAFYTWLYRIAVNTSKNHLVSLSRRPTNNAVDTEDAEYYSSALGLKADVDPHNELMSDQIAEAILKTVNSLPYELQTAITLREQDGLSYEEIAEIMKCPIGTVRSRIFRARAAIDEEIRPFLDK